MEAAGAKVGASIINNVLPHVVGLANNYIRLDYSVKRLVADMDTLKAKRDDRLKEVEKAREEQLGDQTRQGKNWFNQVQTASDNVDKIKVKNQNRRFFHIFSTCCVCIEAVEEHENTKKLLTEEKSLKVIDYGGLSQPRPRQEMIVRRSFVGGDAKLKQVLQCLDNAKEGAIVGLWGMLGVGKSTLLKRIHDTFLPVMPKEKEYDYVIYMKISENFTSASLQEHLATQLGLRQDFRKEMINDRLEKSRFLLLLEDMWQKLDLSEIGIPYPRQGTPEAAEVVVAADDRRRPKPKHHIVFTSNFMDVCLDMHAHHFFEVERLNEEDALRLFQDAAGAENFISFYPDIRFLSKKIAALCDGLPKILTCIGENLPRHSAQTIIEDWNSEYQKLKNGKPLSWSLTSGIYSHYDICYWRLNDERKKFCFLTCSFWPSECDIPKFELITCWMGLGLINTSILPNENFETGNSIAQELQRLHLLEMGETTMAVRMSHIARSFALSQNIGLSTSRWVVLARAGLSQVPIPASTDLRSEVECISCMDNLIEAFPPIYSTCHKLKILVLKGNFPLKEIPSGTLLFMTKLEYLDLSSTGLNNLSSDIGNLSELRYLNLSTTSISSLPKEMSRLVNLKCLILAHTRKLQNIPRGLFSKFSQLNFLDVTGRVYSYDGRNRRNGHNTEAYSASLSELSCLQNGLKYVGITVGTKFALQWLSNNSIPVWNLGITKFRDSSQTLSLLSHTLLGSLNIKKYIKNLVFSDIDVLVKLIMKYDQTNDDDDVEVHNGQNSSDQRNWMFESLQVLKFYNLNSLEEIIWDRVVPRILLPFMRELTIYHCHKLRHISWVLKLPSLESLKVGNCDGLIVFIEESEDIDNFPDFQNLKELVMEVLPRLNSISSHSLTFPSLEHVHLSDCPLLMKLPFTRDIVSNGKLKVIRSERTLLDQLMWEEEEVKELAYTILDSVPPRAATSNDYYAVPPPPPPPPPPPERDTANVLNFLFAHIYLISIFLFYTASVFLISIFILRQAMSIVLS